MNPLALELNQLLENANPHIMAMFSELGRQLFFPKGILSQSAEAREKAHRINATIGIAKEAGHIMRFDSIMDSLTGLRASQTLNYAPSFGIPDLRKRWQQDLFAKNPSLAGQTISLPVVTCGITHGVSTFADMWVDPGDVVILPDMFWGNYNMIFAVRHGARIAHYSLFDNQGGYNLQAFQAAIAREAAAHDKLVVVFNFPHNPTGYTITEQEARQIAAVLLDTAQNGTRVVVALDDAYFGLFYDEQTLKESMFAHLCGQHPNLLAVKLDGATKEHFVWGLRIGFVTYGMHCRGDAAQAYEALEKKTAGCVRGNISNASHLGQSLLLRSLNDPRHDSEKRQKFEILKRRALRVKQVIQDPKYQGAWQAYPFNSGYFMCIRLKTVEAESLRVHLLENYGVGLISLGTHDLRVAFSCIDEDEIQELFDTVLKGVADLEAGA
jgi:aspartate/methionine/tyrosine aminotransferase